MAASLNLCRRGLPQLLSARLPFFYGWVVLACLCCAGFARQGGATATFSVFVEPLTREFGWSRTAISGAASLGGVLAALLSPLIGPLLDRHGSRAALCLAVLGTGIAALLLSLTQSLPVFYLLFCIARLNWASPFELGIYSTLNNWFVARRPLANSIATVAQMAGLVAMPLVAQLAMRGHSWRAGWIAIGLTVLAVGFVPVWLLLVRRPEDLGLLPDNAAAGNQGARACLLAARSRRHFRGARRSAHRPFGCCWLHRSGLSGAGRGQPASGGQFDRTGDHADHGGLDRQPVLADVGHRQRRLRVHAALASDPLSDGVGGLVPDDRMFGDDRHRLAAAGHSGRRAIRDRHRRYADPAAGRLGRLFRPGELRSHPRPGIVGAGVGASRRSAVVRRIARLDRQLHAVARVLCGAIRSQHLAALGRAPAADRSRLSTREPQARRAAPALSSNCSSTS